MDYIDEEVTYTPLNAQEFDGCRDNAKRRFSAVLESLYWQTLGWVHTPPFQSVKPSDLEIKVPRSSVSNKKFNYFTKRSFEPKLQIENKVPYGTLTRDIVADIEKRNYSEINVKSILDEMGIETTALLPSVLIYKEELIILKNDSPIGIPQQPFLELELFDDAWYYDVRTAEEWLSLGDSEQGKKPIPALALIPKYENETMLFNFDWYKVAVLDYDREKKLYLVRMNLHSHVNEKESNADKFTEIWIPRIYVKFDAENPLLFAKRIYNALYTRHVVEENLRINYYVECMPYENTPEWPKEDLDIILEIVRRSRPLQPKLQWIKDQLTKNIKEIQLEHKRAYNYMCYEKISQESLYSLKQFKNETLIQTNYKPNKDFQLHRPFREIFENFRSKTFYTCIEVLRALSLLESNIMALRELHLYNLQNDIYSLEKFDAMQKLELQNISKYIHNTWMPDISSAILLNLDKCGKGSYDLNQTVLHTFKLTKLGKLLKVVAFKMQDTIRFLITESLENFAKTFQDACANLVNIRDNFAWTDSLSSNKLGPLKNPIFEVPLEIKGDRLQFVVDLQKYSDTVRDLFEEGLRLTKDLPRIEKFTMKKMLYNPDDKLDTVGEKEKQIVRWKMDIMQGMDRATVAATAYIRAYDSTLKTFKTDQINYVKQFARTKANCDQLKEVIEMHNNEKKLLENTIPSYIDIGPFRLVTKTVRTAAIKKHEQLADAVLGFFYSKLRQVMESINNQFLMLLDRIDQPTGNIEDLVDKKQWCRVVPKKIEKLSEEVNRLRSDLKIIFEFNRNMEDDDFNTYWQIQKLPQECMKRLQYRISMFDEERKQHREHLSSDQEEMKKNLKQLKATVNEFRKYSDMQKAAAVATDVRKARKNLANLDEQSQLFQKRERLFGLRITQYEEIAGISKALEPYENFWISAAEFKKYKDIGTADLQTIDPAQLRGAIEEFRANLENSSRFFTSESHPGIHRSIISVLKEVEEFVRTRLTS